jgi:uncharacterized protein YbaR (Trm112 family)/SAM-dependent methyltransferase
MKEDVLKILACPMCKASPLGCETSSGTEVLKCPGCGRKYRIENSIPDMLPENIAGDLSVADNEWNIWSDKLQNFIQWRKMTWNGSMGAEKIKSHVDEIKINFVDFTGLRDSGKMIIDIGCGSGLRPFLGSSTYVGIDPLLIEGHSYDFPMVRGVGEHLHFCDGSFDEAVLNQVLDHCNSIDKVLQETMRVVRADGAINVMQYTSEPDSLLVRAYNALIKIYLAIKGVKDLDTKTRCFDRKGIENFFRERFKEVKVWEYSRTQVFIRATGWKENQQ